MSNRTVAREGLAFAGFATWNDGMVDLTQVDKVTLASVTIEGPGIGSTVRSILFDQTKKIFDEHGPRAFESPKSAAATHEAGHVVVHVLHGNRVKRVRITEREPGMWLGLTETYDRLKMRSVAEMLMQARVLYAGVAAEMLFDPEFRQASSLDEVVMSQVLTAASLDADPEAYWRSQVHDVVIDQLRRHRAIHAEIANHLFAHQKLKGARLDEFRAAIKMSLQERNNKQ